jgi:hypothetical protein
MKPEKNELDQRAIVAVLLSLAVLWVWGGDEPPDAARGDA